MMKKHSWPVRAVLFSGAMAFCLAPAMAQDHGPDDHDKTEQTHHKHAEHGNKDAAHGHDVHGHNAEGHDSHGGPGDHGGDHHAGPGGHDAHSGHHKDVIGGVVGALTGAAHGGHDGLDHHAGPERNPHHHFSYNGHRHEAFNGPAFHWPHGHAYHRPHVGWGLPLLFLTAEYMLHDYHAYGLEPPPPEATWVRYGPDILLVNRHSGHVLKVIHGAFAP